MAAPTLIEHQHTLSFSNTTINISLSEDLRVSDVVMIGVDTNNGAQVTKVQVVGFETDDDYKFTKIGVGFSLTVWALQFKHPATAPIVFKLTYGSAYNTTSVIVVSYRGASYDPGHLSGAFDPFFWDQATDLPEPVIETGNPHPAPCVFSTTFGNDVVLYWIGCFVGFAGVAPWTDPTVTGNNTVSDNQGGSWGWVDGLNNTSLLQPIALTMYQQPETKPLINRRVDTSATLSGAAFLVTALTGDTYPQAPFRRRPYEDEEEYVRLPPRYGIPQKPLDGVVAYGQVGVLEAVNPGSLRMRNLLVTSDVDPQEREITLRWSDDRGASWSSPITKTIGNQGDYDVDVLFRRLGMSRDRVFEISWSAPVATALVGAFLEVDIAET